MLASTSTLIFGLLAKATRTATVPTDPEPVNEGFCDTEEPPEELLATHQDPSIQDPSIQGPSIQDAVTARALDQSESREPLKVDLYVHVVARSRKSKAYLDVSPPPAYVPQANSNNCKSVEACRSKWKYSMTPMHRQTSRLL